jgi:hypothetical protein
MPVDTLPIDWQKASHPTENVRGKVRDFHEGKDEVTGVVAQEAYVRAAYLG